MAGEAIVLDLYTKNHGLYSAQTLHSYKLISATAAASAATARGLFGIGVAQWDAGQESLEHSRKEFEHTRKEYNVQLKPLFSAFEWETFALTTLKSFLMSYLPLLVPRPKMEEEDDYFLQDVQEEQHVNLVLPFKKSVKQIIYETTVVTTRWILERITVHFVSQRMAWKLLKDVAESAARKAGRSMATSIYFIRVSRTALRCRVLGVAASWIVEVGIEIYRYFSSMVSPKDESDVIDERGRIKLLGKKVGDITVSCTASLVFAAVGAGIGATLFGPSIGLWICCAVGGWAGPIVVRFLIEKAVRVVGVVTEKLRKLFSWI